MFSMTEACDGPMPKANLPPTAALTESALRAIDMGCTG
jgi:hypothetical protein